MTVQQLIALLSTVDPTTTVFVGGAEVEVVGLGGGGVTLEDSPQHFVETIEHRIIWSRSDQPATLTP